MHISARCGCGERSSSRENRRKSLVPAPDVLRYPIALIKIDRNIDIQYNFVCSNTSPGGHPLHPAPCTPCVLLNILILVKYLRGMTKYFLLKRENHLSFMETYVSRGYTCVSLSTFGYLMHISPRCGCGERSSSTSRTTSRALRTSSGRPPLPSFALPAMFARRVLGYFYSSIKKVPQIPQIPQLPQLPQNFL